MYFQIVDSKITSVILHGMYTIRRGARSQFLPASMLIRLILDRQRTTLML